MEVRAIGESLPLLSQETTAKPLEALSGQPTGEASFGSVFTETVAQANQADHTAAEKVDALARGANDDLHGTMIAVKEADISIKLVANVRNKLLDAFNELWKTSV
jgi:flagellar hook-basal body complex protein FliE